uniref:5-methylthioadenosine/S-adenosylhomocysteine deaminase n=1 Tax=Pyrococcus horikoshii (strain ATCC 700860 / DSM 12428 / JCM 9974 / NBRC 100139 / OT-3) TaxID=70601 RepID=MTAD_PYRHO|nr:RecName: Full=5-methylthioadenosine/S-adenosylhomocysteine deaminase; Short=MTA/SAH deaminase [Pyrococcus horikoshii OT3]
MSILLKGGLILYDTSYHPTRADILIEGDKIVEVKRNINKAADEVIDASHSLIIPAFINAHTHSPMVIFRGLAEDVPLMDWLQNYIWPAERKLKRKEVYWGAKLALLEMVHSGISTFVDMYFYMEEVARATLEVGLRGFLGYGMVDLEDEEKRRKEIKETEKLHEFITKLNSKLVKFILAPHAPYTCSLDCLKWVAEKSREWDSLVTIHLAETRDEIKIMEEKYGRSPVEVLKEANLLNDKLIAAHGIWLSKKDLEMLASSNVTIAHCPASNMKLGSGIFPMRDAIDEDINVALGTDGAASNNTLDIIREMRLASLLQKVNTLNPAIVKSEEIFRMATINGAKALKLKAGIIKEGYIADIAVINLKRSHLLPLHNPLATLIFSAKAGDIDTLIVSGRVIMLDGEVLTIDEEKVIDKFLGVGI